MATTRVTLTLDPETVERIDRASKRMSKPRGEVIREAMKQFRPGKDKLPERERQRLLKILDEIAAMPPTRSPKEVEQELRELRRARRGGGRRTPVE